MPLTIDQRAGTVRRIAELVAELHEANGDSSAEGEGYRQRLMEQLRTLAIPLWLEGRSDD